MLSVFSSASMAQEGTDWLDKDRFQLRVRAVGILADGDGTVKQNGFETNVGDAITPEFDVTYFVTNNIGLELIAATAEHEVSASSADIGETWIIPPTLTLQYHFRRDQAFSPYLGAGINYSIFHNEEAGTGFSDLDIENGFGLALQAGFDYWLNEHWGVNFDVKYIDLDVDVSVDSGATELEADDVDIDPFVVGAGLSYKF